MNESIQSEKSLTIGERLLKAREALRLSREDVARQLRLSAYIIAALEADDYSRIAAPTYTRGYLRALAKLLQLSPSAGKALLDDFDKLQALSKPAPKEEIKVIVDEEEPHLDYKKLRWIGYGVIAVLVIIFISVWIASRRTTPAPQLLIENNIATSTVNVPVLPEHTEKT